MGARKAIDISTIVSLQLNAERRKNTRHLQLPNNLASRSLTCSHFRKRHCQTFITRQPSPLSLRALRQSRLLLVVIFFSQKSLLVSGSFALLQLRWPCQKQPLTNMTVFLDRTTKSGWLGRAPTFRRYLSPNSLSRAATLSSGPVRRFFTRDIISLRLALL